MLQHVMVLSPQGPCFVHRSFTNNSKIDPQVLSGLVAAHESGNRFVNIAKILKAELESDEEIKVEIKKHYNYISAAIASGAIDQEKLSKTLEKINQVAYEALGNPQKVYSLDTEKIKTVEKKIDILLLKEGVL